MDVQKEIQNSQTNGTTSSQNDYIPMAKSLSPQSKAQGNVISVQIKCGKSNIVSRMTYRMRDDSDCSCPDMAVAKDNNSFWEIQSTGLFSNRRCTTLLPQV